LDVQQALEEVKQKILHESYVEDGTNMTVSSFNAGNCDSFEPFSIVKLYGVEPTYSKKNDIAFIGYRCNSISVSKMHNSPFIEYCSLLDVHNLKISYPDPSETYGKRFLIMFEDFQGQNIQKNYFPKRDAFSYITKRKINEKEEEVMQIPLICKQTQGNDTFILMGDFVKQPSILSNFGIPDKNVFSNILAANPVHMLTSCSINLESTRQAKVMRSEDIIKLWINDIKPFLREYLLEQTPSVSWEYVKEKLCGNRNKSDENTFIQTTKSSSFNDNNIHLEKGKMELINDRVVNCSYYLGELFQLKQLGCQFRVMHSQFFELPDRLEHAGLNHKDAEELIAGFPYKVIYAVLPYSEVEIRILNDIKSRQFKIKDEQDLDHELANIALTAPNTPIKREKEEVEEKPSKSKKAKGGKK
jgi:hypothetical protein